MKNLLIEIFLDLPVWKDSSQFLSLAAIPSGFSLFVSNDRAVAILGRDFLVQVALLRLHRFDMHRWLPAKTFLFNNVFAPLVHGTSPESGRWH